MKTRLKKSGNGVGSLAQNRPQFAISQSDQVKSPKIQFVSIADLWEALTRAKEAHGEFERRLGQPDADWPLWFAAYMAAEQGLLGQTLVKTTGQVETPQADSEEDYWSRH